MGEKLEISYASYFISKVYLSLFIPKYIKGKNDQKNIVYECPELEPILNPTYGCIVYQEQVMQIVRDLAGYSYGRSDLVRRAMSKKKASVMEKERKNFVYGNEEEGVPGCISRGIPEKIANHIFDEMTDFAKYAFNKSHAAAYAVLAYQTAFLKYYYPIEYMAALMTSVIDNPSKVAEYIYACRQMGIEILPPDVTIGDADFSVDGNTIRYALSAIKGLGRPVIDALVKEREEHGPYRGMKDFAKRLSGKEVNKRTIESFIKSGAFDSLSGNRHQKMQVYAQMLDGIAQEKKKALDGQISLFDLGGENQSESYELKFPDIQEYTKEETLAFEKEVLGIYISGHPLEQYADIIKKNTTVNTLAFTLDEETGQAMVEDGSFQTIGGMVIARSLKTTKNNTVMAFLTLEDLFGTVEVIVFPRDYEKNKLLTELDGKVFIRGRVSAEEDRAAKIICQEISLMNEISKELWIKYPNKGVFVESEQKLYLLLSDYDGNDSVVVYCESEKAVKRLPNSRNIKVNAELLSKLYESFGESNIRVVEKSIEKH